MLLDNFYVEGEVSADGHEWSDGGVRHRLRREGLAAELPRQPARRCSATRRRGRWTTIARPAGGYIWDRCAEASVSYRSYGEWIDNGKKNADGTFEDSKATVKALEGHFDPKFRGYDLDYPDVKRAERFIEELKRFEKEGEMPRLHRSCGCRTTTPPARASASRRRRRWSPTTTWPWAWWSRRCRKSKFWKETAIFVVEDDAQNGPDHVDAHRTVALVISPYTKRKYVDSTMYSTSSMLRTMELILGLKPMSQFDAAARPMYNSFTAKPDLTPYKHVVPDVDLKEKNKPDGVGGGAVGEVRPGEGGRGGRPAVQRGDLAVGEGGELADAAAGAGGVLRAEVQGAVRRELSEPRTQRVFERSKRRSTRLLRSKTRCMSAARSSALNTGTCPA